MEKSGKIGKIEESAKIPRVYKKDIISRSRVFYYWGLGNITLLRRNIDKSNLIYAHSRVFYYWGLGNINELREENIKLLLFHAAGFFVIGA